MTASKNRMVHSRLAMDSIIKAVMADIHKTSQKPPKGYMTRDQWAAKWGFRCSHQASLYIGRALKIGVLVEKSYRIVTKTGRMRIVKHYGPPPKSKGT